jgi:predicted nucleotidyltransferase
MSIASSLFSDSQTRLLPWLFGQPERSYHLSELRRLTLLGSATLQRELNRLVNSQLVLSTRVGNLRCFQVNTQSPVYAELVAITRKTMGAAPLVLQALQPMASRINLALIYGSVAKGTDTVQSDVDLLLVGKGLVLSEILQLLLPIEEALARKINPTCYTPSEYAKRVAEPDSFVNRILAQPTLPLMGDAHGSSQRSGEFGSNRTAQS